MFLQPVRDRLAAEIPEFKRVAGAAELTIALQRGQFTDTAYVAQTEVIAGKNRIATGHSQEETTRFSVAYWVRDVSDADGQAAMDAQEAWRLKVVNALIGWAPTPDHGTVSYRGGKLLAFRNGGLLWADEFTTAYLLRKLP